MAQYDETGALVIPIPGGSEQKPEQAQSDADVVLGILGKSAKGDQDYSHLITDQLLDNLRFTESSNNPKAVNKQTGAMGAYQFMPSTVDALHKQGIKFNPFDEKESREAARHMLTESVNKHGGDLNAALAEYGGFKDKDPSDYIAKVTGVRPETQYQNPDVKNVLSALDQPITEADLIKPQQQPEVENIPSAVTKLGETLGPTMGHITAGAISAISTLPRTSAAVQQIAAKYLPFLSSEARKKWMESATEGAKRWSTEEISGTHPKSAMTGEIAGAIVNPVNELIPGASMFKGVGAAEKAAPTLFGAAKKAATQGGIYAGLATPVEKPEEGFTQQKIKQVATGAVGGGLFGGGAHLVGSGLEKVAELPFISQKIAAIADKFKGSMKFSEDTNQLDQNAEAILTKSGLDKTKVPPNMWQGFKEQAIHAIKTDDLPSLEKYVRLYSLAEGLPVPVKGLRSMYTRDPVQWGVEHDLRGIPGVGEPIAETIAGVHKSLIQNLDAIGANKGTDITTSGQTLKNALTSADESMRQKVKAAYDSFTASTGKKVEVPLTGLAQDYAQILKSYGNRIPSPVRKEFESYGLLTGKKLKLMSLDNAEDLIKNYINKHVGSDPVVNNALSELRNAVNNAEYAAGENLPGQAGKLARDQRKTAEERKKIIESIPALQDVVKGKEPDKFISSHILNGKVEEISKLKSFLEKYSPETLTQLQNDILAHIKSKVTKGVDPNQAEFSHAQFKGFTDPTDPMHQRLKRFLSADQLDVLSRMKQVADNFLVDPVGSARNKSNSAVRKEVMEATRGDSLNMLMNWAMNISPGPIAAGFSALQHLYQKAYGHKAVAETAAPHIEKALTPVAPKPRTPLSQMIPAGPAGVAATQSEIKQRNQALKAQ